MNCMTSMALALVCLLLAAVPGFAQYFEHDPDDPAHKAPLCEGERAVIPLDTGDPAYNL